MMKSRFLMMLMLALLVSCASFLTGCTKENIVTAMKKSGSFNGKWVSSGIMT